MQVEIEKISDSVEIIRFKDPSIENKFTNQKLWNRIWNDEKIPILDIGERKGYTEYIDFIKIDELTAPVMKGYDIDKRKFFCLKLSCSNGETYSQTFFQRVFWNDDIWVSSAISFIIIMNNFGNISEDQEEFLMKIINGGTFKVSDVRIKFKLLPNLENIEGLTVKLAD